MHLGIYMSAKWGSVSIGITLENVKQFVLFKEMQFHETCSVLLVDHPDTWRQIRLTAETEEGERYTAVRITHLRHTTDTTTHKIEINPCLRYSTDDSMYFDIEIDGD